MVQVIYNLFFLLFFCKLCVSSKYEQAQYILPSLLYTKLYTLYYNYLPTIQDTKQLPLFTHSISTTFAKKFSLDMAQLRELYLDGTVLMRDPHPSTT